MLDTAEATMGDLVAEVARLREANRRLVDVLLDASSDIAGWVQLARKQREELPNVDHLPCGPTTDGIDYSYSLRAKIREAIAKADKAVNP